ncbi:hypothetical protein Hbl1158_10695 [Halobaculum sp. CBA1158]|uniref:hypothetical protein n=1 Tax=Halobaculum sp. CBA1158 TaxID=2904243 RepID=UPI001F165593|nr:hypothetical protein [Halobaculum sp. CBA1158]UIO99001.1 hypothetical protein Hbl1158_10695 [Halobaculum sp. CBA1158]
MHSRRGVLAGATAALASLAGGCLASGSNVSYPSETGTAADGETAGTAARAVDDPDGETDGRESARVDESNPALADRTRRVADEVRWFAETYPDAIETYRRALGRATTATRDLAERDAVTPADAAALETVFEEVVATAESAVGGHFTVHNRLDRRSKYHLGVIEKFARRGDHDRTVEELERLGAFTAGMAAEPYVRSRLSRSPIRNRLVGHLRRGDRDPRYPMLFQVARVPDPTDDGDAGGDSEGDANGGDDGPTGGGGPSTRETADPRPFDRGEQFASYVYGWEREDPGDYPAIVEGPIADRRLLRPPMTDRNQRDVSVAYPPLFVDRGRESTLLVGAHGVDRTDRVADFPDGRPRTTTANATLIQRYRDAAAAESARATLLTRATREGTYPLGDATWERVYYDRDGDVTYALVCRAGEFLLATGANRTAWEERVDWGTLHERTWLGGA